MNRRHEESGFSPVRIAQVLSMIVMWAFVASISLWIFNLLALSRDLLDALGTSVAISIVAIPVFLTLACVLTYVFVTLRAEENRILKERSDK